MAEPQDDVLRLLGDAATFGGIAVRRIDTHAASVFLAGDRALKVKRAVRFPFLDYSTLEKRRAACAAELEVNRPFAPQLYQGLVSITRDANGRLALSGPGEPIEWAVEMRRFDETRTLDRLADAGEINGTLADQLGRAIASAHAAAPIVDARSWVEAIATFLDQNDAEFREAPDLFAPENARKLTAASRAALARLRPLLLARGQLGLVRRGHGDLHLGNIALIEGEPVAFDAIEFNPLIAAGDVLYDLAFLLMDLTERGLTGAANIVLNRYLAETRRAEDLEGLAALPLFLSLRAAIRAKVMAARLARAQQSTTSEIARAARTYFQLASRLIAPAPPRLVAVGGLSGTGKSVLARALAPELQPLPGAVVLRSDVERKARFGLCETERLPSNAYNPEITAQIYATLVDKARRVTGAGHSAIVDAVFAEPDERAAIEAVAAPTGFQGLFLVAALPVRLARIGSRMHDASDADAEVVRRQENYDIWNLGWTKIDAAGTPTATLALVRAALG